jgi:diguanylate cyclase (GGDEF)-like protein
MRERLLMTRAGAVLLAAGGALALLIVGLPHSAQIDEFAVVALGGLSLLCGAIVFALGSRLPRLGCVGIALLGIALVTASIHFSGTEANGVAENELIYLWPTMYAAYFFKRSTTALLLGFTVLAYGAVLFEATDGSPFAARWIGTVITLGGAAAFVHWLRERLDRDVSLQQATIESTTDGILVVDGHGRWITFNNKFLGMWKMPRELAERGDDDAAIEFVLDQLVDPGRFIYKVRELYERPEAESYDELVFKDGRVLERYSQPQRIDGRAVGRVWSFRDVTDRRRFEERLQHLADHDPLTDLFNRRRFEDELEREVARASRYGHGGALLLMDLDDFKSVNDTFGHIWGDETLRRVAVLLRERLRTTDVLARLGGDEFAVLLPEGDGVRAVKLAEELLEVLRSQAIETDDGAIRVTTSIGVISLDSLEGSTLDPLVAADAAMYRAKHEGRDRVAEHQPEKKLQPQRHR